ncbi:MAG: hypothetical protein WCQ41_01170 [Bacillota bacterium]
MKRFVGLILIIIMSAVVFSFGVPAFAVGKTPLPTTSPRPSFDFMGLEPFQIGILVAVLLLVIIITVMLFIQGTNNKKKNKKLDVKSKKDNNESGSYGTFSEQEFNNLMSRSQGRAASSDREPVRIRDQQESPPKIETPIAEKIPEFTSEFLSQVPTANEHEVRQVERPEFLDAYTSEAQQKTEYEAPVVEQVEEVMQTETFATPEIKQTSIEPIDSMLDKLNQCYQSRENIPSEFNFKYLEASLSSNFVGSGGNVIIQEGLGDSSFLLYNDKYLLLNNAIYAEDRFKYSAILKNSGFCDIFDVYQNGREISRSVLVQDTKFSKISRPAEVAIDSEGKYQIVIKGRIEI